MTTIPLRRFPGLILILVISTALIILPSGAVTLDPSGPGSSNTITIANGDPVLIHGIATGHPQRGLQLWIISHNYLKVTSLSVNDDNTYLYELRPADTQNLASGQYFFLVQHPMMNGQFDIVYDRSSGSVLNKQLGQGQGTEIFRISGAGNLQGPDSAQALVDAIGSQNIDDTFAPFSFYISPPETFISPIGDHYVGDRFTISGSTNLAPGDNLMVDITSSSFEPTEKSEGSEFSGTSGVVEVVQGSGSYNRWSFDVDATAFKPDEYIVTVSGITQHVTGSAYFNIQERPVITSLTTTVAVPETTDIPATTVPLRETTAPAKSPLPFWLVLGALVIPALAGKKS